MLRGDVMNSRVLMQYFEWYLDKEPHLWNRLRHDVKHLRNIGINSIWMPPCFKGISGSDDVGYGVYDLYDLGEFDVKGSISTKYGTKEEYVACINEIHEQGLEVISDLVLNHKMGADDNEEISVHEVSDTNKYQIISDKEMIISPTIYTFPARKDKYSAFHWNHKHFSGIDYDMRTKRHATFLFEDKQWNEQVDEENGNFDYLMGADIDFNEPEVINELTLWIKWYYEITHFDGLRLDAIKHIPAYFYKDYIKMIREYTHKEIFTVGEYWHGDVERLIRYLNEVDYEISLFDVPLHYHFYDLCHNEDYDFSKVFSNTLVERSSNNAVTFVDNHDTQPSQGLQSWIEDWFKPLAYALILLRKEGTPCIFYGDYYGIPHNNIAGKSKMIDKLLYLRNNYAIGCQDDYFDHNHIIGWVRNKEVNPLVILMSNKNEGIKKMYVGCAQWVFKDIYGYNPDVIVDEEGFGVFKVSSKSMSIYIRK